MTVSSLPFLFSQISLAWTGGC